MGGGVHYGEVEGLVSVERWSCSRGASCVVEYTMGRPVGARRCLEACGGIGRLGGGGTQHTTALTGVLQAAILSQTYQLQRCHWPAPSSFLSHYSKGSDGMQCVPVWHGNDRYTQ